MKTQNILFFVTMIITSTLVLAGGNFTGGGNIVACYDKGTKKDTFQLLDYYDATRENGYNFKLDLGPGLSYQNKIDHVLNRLEKVDQYRARLYKVMSDRFLQEVEFNSKSDNGFATDSNDIGS